MKQEDATSINQVNEEKDAAVSKDQVNAVELIREDEKEN